jgi:hypothetical protein
MRDLLATLAIPLYGVLDLVLDSPASAIAIASGLGMAIAIALLAP